MPRPRLLDLYGGAGGCAMGYHQAGFDVVCIDIEPHPTNPFELIVMDAHTALRQGLADSFDVVHASPPCQGYTTMSAKHRGKGTRADEHDRTIPETRELLERTGRPYVIENVAGARIDMRAPILLRGSMFGLAVDRPRLFESNVPISPPPYAPPRAEIGVYGRTHDGRRLTTRADGTELRAARTLDEARAAMGIDWMDWHDLTEAIPPAYTEWIGREILFALEAAS